MPQPNVDPERIHVVLNRREMLMVIDALRSVGSLELAERFEVILGQTGAASDQWWTT